MSLSFRIVCSAIWTIVALIYLTSGAPAAIKPAAHKASSTGQNQCVIFDYIVLPMYEVDGEVANQKPDNLTVALEVCYVTHVETVAPLCQEADELLRNLSTCSPEVNMLKAVEEYIRAEKSNSIVIAPQTNVCHGFMDNRNNFANSSFAYKLSDPVICPLICQDAMKKACTFLLWGYQVQATIHAIWEKIVSNEPSDVKVEMSTEKIVKVSGEKPSKESGSANEGKAEVSDSANEGKAEVNDSVKDENLATTGGDVSSIEKEKSSGYITGGSKPAEAGLQTSARDVVSLTSDSELNHGTEKLTNIAKVSKPVVSASEQTKSKPEAISDAHKVSSPPISNQQVNADGGKANTVSQTDVTTSATVARKSKSGLQPDQNDPQPTEGNQEESGKQNKESTEKSEEHKSSAENTDGILKQTATILPVENNEKEYGNVKEVPEMGEENGISKNSPAPQKNTEKVSSTVSAKHSESSMSDDVSNVNQEAKDGGKNSKASKIPAGDSSTNIDSPKNEENPDEDISGTNHDDVDGNKPEVHDKTSDEVPASDKGTKGDTGAEGSSVETLSTSNTYPVEDPDESTNYIDNGIGEGGGIELNEDSEGDIGLNDDTEMKAEKVKGDDDDADSDQSQIVAGGTGNDDRSNIQTPGQQTNVLNNKAGSILEDSPIIPFPEQEDTHFFFYFVTIIVFAIGGYVLFHNKQKIFALIIEGRHERRRRSGASYRKLETK